MTGAVRGVGGELGAALLAVAALPVLSVAAAADETYVRVGAGIGGAATLDLAWRYLAAGRVATGAGTGRVLLHDGSIHYRDGRPNEFPLGETRTAPRQPQPAAPAALRVLSRGSRSETAAASLAGIEWQVFQWLRSVRPRPT